MNNICFSRWITRSENLTCDVYIDGNYPQHEPEGEVVDIHDISHSTKPLLLQKVDGSYGPIKLFKCKHCGQIYSIEGGDDDQG